MQGFRIIEEACSYRKIGKMNGKRVSWAPLP
jgi:hypothetical protein